MFSIGALIWISLRPLLRLAIGVAAGFAITKADMFPPVAARGASQVILNVTVPCLMFSKIVPAFNAENIRVFGPLFLVAAIYEILGIILAWMTKQVFWVPHRFRYGILVAGGWGNVGDIPISVILSVTGAAPFNGVGDQNLSIAYISVFLLVFIFSLFPMGGHRWVSMDYVGPDVENCDIRDAMKIKRRKLFFMSPSSTPEPSQKWKDLESSKHPEVVEEKVVSEDDLEAHQYMVSQRVIPPLRRHDTVHDDSTAISEIEETVINPNSPRDFQGFQIPKSPIDTDNTSPSPPISFHRPNPLTKSQIFLSQLTIFLKSLLSAPSLSIIISFPIALIPVLKGLFVLVPSAHIPSAPDGQPPLSFLMDTATFMGAASVPLGLVCLGSALARLKIPRSGQWGALPVGAISSLAVGKLLVMPVLGVVIVQGLVRGGVIPEDDKVLQFVCIFCSCLPTATTQVYLTQVYSGTGDAEHLSAFLIPQYILMFISMTTLTAYTLHLIF